MAWTGTGLVWTIEAGLPVSRAMGQTASAPTSPFSFVQISDSHIGFNKAANPDVTGTLQIAIDRINGLEGRAAFVLHTGDLTHGANASEFDTVTEMLKGARRDVFYVPGE